MFRKLSLFAAFARTLVKYDRERLFWVPKAFNSFVELRGETLTFAKTYSFTYIFQAFLTPRGLPAAALWDPRTNVLYRILQGSVQKLQTNASWRITLKPYKSIVFYSTRCDSVVSRKLKFKLPRCVYYYVLHV